MERSYIVAVTSVLAALGAILPIAAAFYLSWSVATSREEARLTGLAEYAIKRADAAFGEATTALKTADGFAFAPCSQEHISAMRTLVVTTRSIEDIGYFENDQLKCTSWGKPETTIARQQVDFTTASGIGVAARVHPTISNGQTMLGFRYRSYSVLTDPARLVDVLISPDTRLAIANEAGILVSGLNNPDPALIKRLIAHPQTGADADGDDLFAKSNSSNWIAIATSSRASLLNDLGRERLLLLPLGAIVAALMVGLVFWLSRRRLSPLGELSIAVQRREFIVHYQPLIEMKTGICVGAEALVRWRRPDGSLVRPDTFIPLAEESGLIQAITDQVIDGVIRDLGPVLLADRSLHIAINLSAEDIKSGRVLPVIQDALASSGVLTEQIWLEATERGFMDVKSARATIEEARRLGHSVAIDDFGTGYSSLQYLQDLPLDALKIDKSFIDTVGLVSATSAVTPHIIDIAKSLNLYIVAEGIERQEQADYLLERGVHYGQGWLYSKALPAQEFIAFYNESKRVHGAGPAVIRRDFSMAPPAVGGD
ncbi:EAL domain-containing protein [Ensifer sp. HO-A22]|uniref:cyclic-guanylate-specific phosphodiesterase n=1 Tax=Ensifer oleiphilus TaxID=2742698 RepID=A0A7Y6ULJ7_9HYPH|nr:EAL domain-containing protein [Ensifer oleiphilus]NVD38175.1 EAL domain-containing protein [Ensifer oleiphilus]